jgi:hypothetical protein
VVARRPSGAMDVGASGMRVKGVSGVSDRQPAEPCRRSH